MPSAGCPGRSDADGVLAGMQMGLIDVGVANAELFNAWTQKGEGRVRISGRRCTSAAK